MSHADGKAANQVIEQTANDVDQVKRQSFPYLFCVGYGLLHVVSENQLRENIHKWLSPPDPSTNHNIACDTHHKRMATWFIKGSVFREWKSAGPLLWIRGKRAPCLPCHPIPSDDSMNYSWVRQEYSLVSGCSALSIIRD